MCDSCARRCWLCHSANRRGAEGEKAEQAGGTVHGNISWMGQSSFLPHAVSGLPSKPDTWKKGRRGKTSNEAKHLN